AAPLKILPFGGGEPREAWWRGSPLERTRSQKLQFDLQQIPFLQPFRALDRLLDRQKPAAFLQREDGSGPAALAQRHVHLHRAETPAPAQFESPHQLVAADGLFRLARDADIAEPRKVAQLPMDQR